MPIQFIIVRIRNVELMMTTAALFRFFVFFVGGRLNIFVVVVVKENPIEIGLAKRIAMPYIHTHASTLYVRW